MSVSGQELLRQVKAEIEEVDPADVLDLMHGGATIIDVTSASTSKPKRANA